MGLELDDIIMDIAWIDDNAQNSQISQRLQRINEFIAMQANKLEEAEEELEKLRAESDNNIDIGFAEIS